MKNCKSFEKKLTAYLFGELNERDFQTLETHLESCAACRAAREAQRQTLALLGKALEAAPAPAELTARRFIPSRVPAHRPTFADYWYSPKLTAALVTGAAFSVLFLISISFVAVSVIKKEDMCFEAKTINRPEMSLKKLRVPSQASNEKQNPKLRKRVAAKTTQANLPELQMPEIAGTRGDIGAIDAHKFGSDIGFSMPVGDDLAAFNQMLAGADPQSGSDSMVSENAPTAPSPKPALTGTSRTILRKPKMLGKESANSKPVESYGYAAVAAAEPAAMPPAAPMVSGDRLAMAGDSTHFTMPEIHFFGSKQKATDEEMALLRDRSETDADRSSGIIVPDTKMPEVAGRVGGIDSLGEISVVNGMGYSTSQDDLFGDAVGVGETFSRAAPAPAKPDATLATGVLWMDESPREEPALAGVEVATSSSMLGYGASVDDDREGRLKAEVGVDKARNSSSARELEELDRGGQSFGLEKDMPTELRRKLEPAVFNPYTLAVENAFSTFSIDVDTASYGLARNRLLGGGLPDPELVRTEEFINSFDYDYRPPTGKQTFSVHSEMAPSPFRTGMDVLKVGIKGRRIGRDDHRGAVLTLVIDTSGSMSTPERLGLVKESLALLLDQLGPDDEVAIVQFGGAARLVREHTPASDKAALLEAINALQPGGPTQFDKGLELGYQLAMTGFRAGDSNRIIILSDGVANLGELDPEAILEQVAEQRKKGIYLSVLGFGAGTYDDDLLERLANRGDGMYAYIDTLDEARHLLVDQLAATLHVIASDVKIQIEFNPARVLRYRQLGYENRQLTKEQFRDDTVDAGEVGSGQSVTALYDVELKPDGPEREPIATVYVRYRRADNGAVEEISSRVTESVRAKRFEDADLRFRLAACTAEFAERLRRSPYADGTDMKDIFGRLQPVALELDLDGQVQELLRLISIADGLER
jgi:Ca-activated chloride channel family protein